MKNKEFIGCILNVKESKIHPVVSLDIIFNSKNEYLVLKVMFLACC